MAELIANRHEKRYGIKPDIILKKNGQEKNNLFLLFSSDLILKEGFKPQNNYLNEIDKLFEFVKAKFVNAN